jgi:hypothetical protein
MPDWGTHADENDDRVRRLRRLCGHSAGSPAACLVCLLFMARDAEALNPDKRVSRHIHTSRRIQDGSLPAGMSSIAQPPMGFSGCSLFRATSTGSMAFGACVGRCLPAAIVCDGALIASHLSLHAGARRSRTNTTGLSVVERTTIANVLRDCRGNKTKAARRLGLSRTQLHWRVRKYRLEEAAIA